MEKVSFEATIVHLFMTQRLRMMLDENCGVSID